MSRRVMVDQIAFDEAEQQLIRSIKKTGIAVGWTDELMQAEVSSTRTLIALIRLALFDTEKSLITTQEEKR